MPKKSLRDKLRNKDKNNNSDSLKDLNNNNNNKFNKEIMGKSHEGVVENGKDEIGIPLESKFGPRELKKQLADALKENSGLKKNMNSLKAPDGILKSSTTQSLNSSSNEPDGILKSNSPQSLNSISNAPDGILKSNTTGLNLDKPVVYSQVVHNSTLHNENGLNNDLDNFKGLFGEDVDCYKEWNDEETKRSRKYPHNPPMDNNLTAKPDSSDCLLSESRTNSDSCTTGTSLSAEKCTNSDIHSIPRGKASSILDCNNSAISHIPENNSTTAYNSGSSTSSTRFTNSPMDTPSTKLPSANQDFCSNGETNSSIAMDDSSASLKNLLANLDPAIIKELEMDETTWELISVDSWSHCGSDSEDQFYLISRDEESELELESTLEEDEELNEDGGGECLNKDEYNSDVLYPSGSLNDSLETNTFTNEDSLGSIDSEQTPEKESENGNSNSEGVLQTEKNEFDNSGKTLDSKIQMESLSKQGEKNEIQKGNKKKKQIPHGSQTSKTNSNSAKSSSKTPTKTAVPKSEKIGKLNLAQNPSVMECFNKPLDKDFSKTNLAKNPSVMECFNKKNPLDKSFSKTKTQNGETSTGGSKGRRRNGPKKGSNSVVKTLGDSLPTIAGRPMCVTLKEPTSEAAAEQAAEGPPKRRRLVSVSRKYIGGPQLEQHLADTGFTPSMEGGIQVWRGVFDDAQVVVEPIQRCGLLVVTVRAETDGLLQALNCLQSLISRTGLLSYANFNLPATLQGMNKH